MTILWGILLAVFCLVCLLIIAIVLLQPHQGEGLAGVFGGGGGETFLGAKSITTAVWITSVLAGIYMLLALTVNKIAPTGAEEGVMVSEPGKIAPPPPAPAATTSATSSAPAGNGGSKPPAEQPPTPPPPVPPPEQGGGSKAPPSPPPPGK